MDHNETTNIVDKRLNNYRVPPASSNLSVRIIAAAHQNPQKSLWRIIVEETVEMFYIPRPAYAVTFCLIFGVILGVYNEVDQLNDLQNYMTFLDINEVDTSFSYMDEGGWL